MEWKCFTCEHTNNPNFTECEVCGTVRNLYAEEVFKYREEIKKNETQLKVFKNGLTKVTNEKQKLVECLTSINEQFDVLQISLSEADEKIKLLQKREIALATIIKQQEFKIDSLNVKISEVNNVVKERDKLISFREARLRGKDDEVQNIKLLNENLQSNLKRNKRSIWILYILLFSIMLILYYKLFYLVNVMDNKVSKVKQNFEQYLDSIPKVKCVEENIKVRETFLNDINKDGNLEGIVVATYNGIDCQNNFEQILYIYNLQSKFFRPLAQYSLSRTNEWKLNNEDYYSFYSIRRDTIVFNKIKLHSYNKKKINSYKLRNSYSRINLYTDSKFDTLYYPNL